MSPAWRPRNEPRRSGPVTLFAGSSFCTCAGDGEIQQDTATGYFVQDTRLVSVWAIDLVPDRLDTLLTRVPDPNRAQFISRRVRSDGATALLLTEERVVDTALTSRLRIRNAGTVPTRCVLRLRVDADFADVFDVKESSALSEHRSEMTTTVSGLDITCAQHHGSHPDVAISVTGDAIILPGQFLWDIELAAGGAKTVVVRVEPRPQQDEATGRSNEAPAWPHARLLFASGSDALTTAIERTTTDVSSLRLFDPRHPGRPVVAAGAPWFMALFGRDALLTSLMVLPHDRALAVGTLAALAESQGRSDDPQTEEQPGRIVHEVRFGRHATLALGGRHRYFGTADATPLFVMLVGELSRWGAPEDTVREFLPAVDRALRWILGQGDADGDGFVEYRQVAPHGLHNQGWKDSPDAICRMDGSLADPPIALCEVQAYCYAAFLARAHLARRLNEGSAEEWEGRAAILKEDFNRAFWLPHRGWYAMALDGAKRPVDAPASNMAHAMWTGIVAQDNAVAVARALTGPRLWTGWGLRTLGEGAARFDPMSYHNGSVWPHDTAIAAAGLMRYGFVAEATEMITGLLDAAHQFRGRLPELFCGFGRDEFDFPVPYPTACSPQAWASASPYLLVRTMLRLDPDVPTGVVRLDPAVPPQLLPLTVSNLMIGDSRASITVDRDGCTLTGLPAGVEWQTGAGAGDEAQPTA